MRMSDWSSAVCSSGRIELYFLAHQDMSKVDRPYFSELLKGIINDVEPLDEALAPVLDRKVTELTPVERGRSEERRVGRSVSVRVDLGGRRVSNKKNKIHRTREAET